MINNKRINSIEFNKQIIFYRYLYVIILILIIINYNYINELFKWFYYNILYQSSLFQYESFEPILASLSFGLFIFIFRYIDYNVNSLHIYRIQSNDSLHAWNKRSKAFYEEVLWYLLPLLIIDLFIKRRKVPNTCPSLYQLVIEVISCLISYDFFFFIGHYYLHNNKILYKYIHSKHHNEITIRATDSIRHTFLDGSYDVLCSVISINLLQLHVYSRLIYNIIAIYLIVEAHCGMSMPWMLCNVIPFHIVGGPNTHDLHHTNGNVNYHKFFTYLDSLSNTLKY